MPARVVVPEILDHLPHDHPSAIRSRRDLRMINFLMGNDRWLLHTAGKFPAAAAKGITEIGAGDGTLTRHLARKFPASTITAYDLAPPPADLPSNIEWKQGDLFAASPPSGGILIANLFLHHFEGHPLHLIGEICDGFEVLLFSEPARGRMPHLLGNLMQPFINHVTRHDMHVSINAGFESGELSAALGLSSKRLQIREHSTWRGAYRMLGLRL